MCKRAVPTPNNFAFQEALTCLPEKFRRKYVSFGHGMSQCAHVQWLKRACIERALVSASALHYTHVVRTICSHRNSLLQNNFRLCATDKCYQFSITVSKAPTVIYPTVYVYIWRHIFRIRTMAIDSLAKPTKNLDERDFSGIIGSTISDLST